MTGVLFPALDSDVHPVFRLYSGGNYAEVAPERLSVMSWSLVGLPTERGFRDLVERLWPSSQWQKGSHFTFVGYFGGRPYHNLSALGHLANQLPWGGPSDVTSMYFEDTQPPEPPRGLRPGAAGRLGLLYRLPRELASLRNRLTELEAQVVQLEHETREALRSGSLLRVGAALRQAELVLDTAWKRHLSNTATLVPLHALQHDVGEWLVDGWEPVSVWLNRPEELVWGSLYDAANAGGDLGSGEFLGAAFYELADETEPFKSLVRRHTVDPTGSSGALAGTDSRGVDVDGAFWGMRSRLGELGLRPLTRLVGNTMEVREAGKSLVMRCLHVFRRMLPLVADDVGVKADEWPYLTYDELRAARTRDEVAAIALERRDQFEQALEMPIPPHLDLDGQTLEEAVATGHGNEHRTRQGRGVSAGLATGVAVTSATIDRYEDAGDKILVCESADADVEPLLSRVAGLISARGSVLSHIAILVRERGLPGVVGHPLAAELRPGDVVSIDGTTGEAVRLEEEDAG
jgi:rifampicin phosphotransferase